LRESRVAFYECAAGGGNEGRCLGSESVCLARLLPEAEFADSVDACQEWADAAVVSTEWDEFRALDLARVKARDGEIGDGGPPQRLSGKDDERFGGFLRLYRPGARLSL
jgi:hypothetical protein